MSSKLKLRLLCSVVILAAAELPVAALEGFPIRVTRNGSTIKNETQVIGKASRDMLLWVFKLSPDEQWAFVKVPSSDRVGWMSIGSATNIDIPSEAKARWDAAHNFFAEWKDLMDRNLPEEAAKVAEKAGDTMISVLEDEIGSVYPGYPPSATAFNQAGVALLQAGQADTAVTQFEKAIEIAEASIGQQHTNTSIYRANLAEANTHLGNFSAAIEGFDISLPVLEEHKNSLSDVPLESYFVQYGKALASEHRIFDARLAFGKALRTVISKHGERSGEVARVAALFAAAMDQAGQRDDAVRQLTRSLEIYREIVDAEHPLMIDTLNRLSAYSTRTESFADAAKYAREAVEIQRDIDEPNQFQLASSLNNLGLALAKLKQFDEAETVLEEAEKLMTKATSEDSFVSTFPKKNLAILAMERNQPDVAKKLLEEVMAIRRESQPEGDRSIGVVHGLLGELAIAGEDSDSARNHFSEAVRIQGGDIGIDHPDTLANVKRLRDAIGDSEDGQKGVDEILALARREMRSRVIANLPQADKRLDAIAREYRLQRVLAARQKTKPEELFFALEVTEDNASVRTGDLISPTLAAGTVVYAFRAQGDQAFIKIPGSDKLGWIAQESVNEIKYGGELRGLLAEADQELDEGYREHQEGNSKSAVLRIRKALRTFDQELGEDSAPAAAARFTLGGVLAASGDAKLAVEECVKAEAALADLLGEEHFETAKARNNLSDALLALGKPAEALAPAVKALRAASAFGEEQRDFQARVAGNVGAALRNLTHYETAREYIDYALKLSLEANGENHFGTARCYSNLGKLYTELKEFEEAEVAFGKAYRIAERVSDAADAETTKAMVEYGLALVSNQKIAEGRKLIDEAARINLRERGPMDLSTIQSDSSRADIALNVGDTNAARSLLDDVVRRAGKRLGPKHPQTLRYRRSLAEAFYIAGEYEASLKEAQTVANTFETTLDENNHETIDAVRQVGVYSAALGRLDVARVNFEKALRLATKVLGRDHPDTIRCLLNIGEIALMAKDYVAARPRIEAAIVAMQQNRTHVVSETCQARTLLGYVDMGQADARSALQTFDKAAKDSFKLMSTVLPALSEKEQLLFLQNDLRDMQNAWLTLPLQRKDLPELAEAAAIWHLNMKASSHELLATQARVARDIAGAGDESSFTKLVAVREKLARLTLQSVSPEARSTHDEAVRKLTEEESQLAREIGDAAARSSESRRWKNWADFRPNIANDSVLINFARIRNANFLYSSEKTRWKGDRYVAYVVPSSDGGEVVAVDLGLASSIDKRIATTLDAIHSESAISQLATSGEVSATKNVTAELTSLAERILQPLLPHLENCEELILSPDSQLWTIPWAAMPISENQMAIERFRIRLAVSGRELSAEDSSPSETEVNSPLIVADPSFDMNPSVELAFNDPDPLQLRSARFGAKFRDAKRLPGTAAEAEAIRGSLESYANGAPKMFLRRDAVEGVVKQAKSPFCLVLSTHGFFFPSAEQTSVRRSSGNAVVTQNPLLRCGLLMAGCHFADEAPEGEDDGILTGMEIIGSDLRNTELVVLSACETGLGDLRGGEGVAGLRQAFQLAGAKAVVASLWQVEDDATARLMNEFFQNLAGGMTKSEALRQAQLARIKARRERNGAAHPFFWAAFTLTGNN